MKLSGKNMRLYAVSDRQWSRDTDDFLIKTEACLKNGVTVFQLREKNTSYDKFKSLALAVKPLCKKYGTLFIINDNVELAKEVDADGVHIGQDDDSLSKARAILGKEKIIGVSAHNADEARAAERGGADYLGSGAAFGSSTKTDAGAISFDTLKAVAQAVNIPVVAIGGITAENAAQLCGLGLDGIAVVSAIFAKEDTAKATEDMRRIADKIAVGSNK